ncbi:MAG: metallophosphoesterase [Gammaproteobacteria bacterium]|nr:MAG: metallophosphoesterase [Gammaproteobacteria bacterium]
MSTKTKILIYGDPHGNFEPLFEAVETASPTAVIILGDFGLQAPLEQVLAPILNKTDIWFIHGNHDTDRDNDYHFLFNSQLADRNIGGKVITINGARIAGLGGVFREKIWHPNFNDGKPTWRSRSEYMHAQPKSMQRQAEKYAGLHRQHHSSIWHEDYVKLASQHADILISHEAPSCFKHGFEEIEELALSMGVMSIYHGHHHQSYNEIMELGKYDILVNGVGLAEVKAFTVRHRTDSTK